MIRTCINFLLLIYNIIPCWKNEINCEINTAICHQWIYIYGYTQHEFNGVKTNISNSSSISSKTQRNSKDSLLLLNILARTSIFAIGCLVNVEQNRNHVHTILLLDGLTSSDGLLTLCKELLVLEDNPFTLHIDGQ